MVKSIIFLKNTVSQNLTYRNLYINGLISQFDSVKVLGNGEIKGKFIFKVNAVSDKAKTAIEAAGGSVEIVK
ncbi:MAG: uL15m family ribosomal protein [Ferruginibacter sp.]